MPTVLFLALAAHAAPIQLQSSDGVALAAEHDGSGKNGVVLVHGKGGSNADWAAIVGRLSAGGFNVVALDLRGHGGSAGAPLAEDDFPKMTADVDAAVGWLRSHGAETVGVIGAELGANVALNAASDNTGIDNLLLLSPGLNHDGVKVGAAIAAYGKRPLLLVAGASDTMASKAATILADKTVGPKHLELPDTSAKGPRLLTSVPDLESLVISWLNGSFRSASDPTSMRPEISAAGGDQIETTGTRLEDRR